MRARQILVLIGRSNIKGYIYAYVIDVTCDSPKTARARTCGIPKISMELVEAEFDQ